MIPPVFLPINIKLTKKCERCGLRHPKKEQECSHCATLSDREVEDLKLRFEEENQGNASLGKIFIAIGFVLAFLVAAILIQ